MKLIVKSILYGLYFTKIFVKGYLPVVIYLVLSQFLIMKTQNILLVVLFFLGYLIVSIPIALNIFRNIISKEDLLNDYLYFFRQEYTGLFIKKIFYLLISIIIIYTAHIIVLSPLFPTDISQITIYLYILFMYMLYIYTRIMFILPAAAYNISKGLKDSYLISKGKSIKIYFSYIAIILPYLFINVAITNYAENSSNFGFFVIPVIIIQVFFTIVSSALIGYMYSDFYNKPKDITE